MEYKLKGPEPREYQKAIAETASKKNTLVVLPTGMGKTLIAVLVGLKRLNDYPESKILIVSPTKPLSAQHKKSFEEFTSINPDEIILLTGKIRPEDRIELYKKSKIIVATPQTIENDLINDRLSLENFSFLTVDECHRSVKNYSYPMIAKKYMLQSKFPLILGLTASPGGTHEKIDEIRNNLFIKAVEIRTEEDIDVERYVQLVQREFVYVDFPEEFKKIKILLEEILKDDLYWLREHHYTFTYKPTKTMLLAVQKRVIESYTRSRNYGAFWAIMRVAGAIKIEHAIELLETQGIKFLYEFLKKIERSKKKTDTRLTKNPRMGEAIKITEDLYARGIEHPKLEKIIDIIKNLLKDKPNTKVIVFANFRLTVDRINELLRENGIDSEILIGQAIKEGRGLTQQQQIEILKRFANNEFSVLCGTQVSEEGLDVGGGIDVAIFYEPVPSEIRTIQRRGRVGRQITGKVIFLITKDTRDEAYYWASFQKEKKMKGILYKMKDKTNSDKKKTLLDWVK